MWCKVESDAICRKQHLWRNQGGQNSLLAVQSKSTVALTGLSVGFRKCYRRPHGKAFSLAKLVVLGRVEGLVKAGWFSYDLIKAHIKARRNNGKQGRFIIKVSERQRKRSKFDSWLYWWPSVNHSGTALEEKVAFRISASTGTRDCRAQFKACSSIPEGKQRPFQSLIMTVSAKQIKIWT